MDIDELNEIIEIPEIEGSLVIFSNFKSLLNYSTKEEFLESLNQAVVFSVFKSRSFAHNKKYQHLTKKEFLNESEKCDVMNIVLHGKDLMDPYDFIEAMNIILHECYSRVEEDLNDALKQFNKDWLVNKRLNHLNFNIDLL